MVYKPSAKSWVMICDIGYSPDPMSLFFSFWINHDLIKVRPLVPVLEEIKRFIEKTKDEVILLDLHRFPAGFNGRPSRHDRLVELLEREFKEYAVPYSESLPTLGDIWRQQKRIIISYAHNILPKR